MLRLCIARCVHHLGVNTGMFCRNLQQSYQTTLEFGQWTHRALTPCFSHVLRHALHMPSAPALQHLANRHAADHSWCLPGRVCQQDSMQLPLFVCCHAQLLIPLIPQCSWVEGYRACLRICRRPHTDVPSTYTLLCVYAAHAGLTLPGRAPHLAHSGLRT